MKKQVTRPVQAHLLRGASYLLMLLAVCAIPFALAQQNPSKPSVAKPYAFGANAHQSRSLSFADRVAYQRVIEDVYWRHRIWPDSNPDPKPPLDEVMSQAEIEKKVEDYLRNSQALEDHWQRPITADQLQTEMERMASHTKQPEVLHEVFEALGNDPFVIAECLARPVLAERLNNGDAAAPEPALSASRTGVPPAPAVVATPLRGVTRNVPQARGYSERPMTMATVSANYTLPVIAGPSGGCIDDTWTPTSMTNVPAERSGHTAVWTGSEMIVWGGHSTTMPLNTGGRYDPSTDSWTATSTTNAPADRVRHTAVWSGSEMVIWGGCNGGFCINSLNTGGRYNPSSDSWTATTTTNAPAGRAVHTAVWSDGEMIVWGGCINNTNLCNQLSNTGGRYNPSSDSWTATSTTGAPTGRDFHTAVWTGTQMIVWGGRGPGESNDGGRYNPSTNSWTATTTTNAPSARDQHAAVWTDSEMIVWGGYPALNTGGRYNPGTDSWTATSTTNAPSGRYAPTAVWTDSEMIVWGGIPPGQFTNTGGRYCGAASSPTPTPTASPTPTATATASPSPTPTPTPTGCGLLIGSGLTLGAPSNGFTLIASNTVNYTFANSQAAPNEFAVFQTHDPWGGTILAEAITTNGHTYTEFTPAHLAGFAFSDYRVVVLNWDDTVISDFLADYTAAIPALETYVNGGGVVWVQASIQGNPFENFPMPFGGQGNGYELSVSDNIVDPASPMMTGVPNPIVGKFASSVSESGLPRDAHIVVINPNDQQPVIYDLRRGPNCGGGTPTPTPTATATATATASSTPRPSPTPRLGPTPRPRPTPVPRP